MNHLEEIQKILVGRPVSNIWRGYGSALFLEFGNLTPRKKRDGSPGRNAHGDITLMIQWSWRIENPRSILTGSWGSEDQWPKVFRSLLRLVVTEVSFFSTLPELQVTLSNGKRVSSFMTAEGQPQWAVISRVEPLGSWSVERGVVAFAKDSDLRRSTP
jgi:hypothetical protein